VSAGLASFEIRVTNTGDVPVDNVQVTDAAAPDCARTGAANLGTIAPGQIVSYTCTQSDVMESFTNVATVSGEPPSGPPVTHTDVAGVVVVRLPVTGAGPRPVNRATPMGVFFLVAAGAGLGLRRLTGWRR
jgi:hypothetical protein